MSNNNPVLVNALLEGKVNLTAIYKKPDKDNVFRRDVLFGKAAKYDEEYSFKVVPEGCSFKQPSTAVPIDFDILEGLCDILCLIAAFVNPEVDVMFLISSGGDKTDGAKYLVEFVDTGNGKKERCVSRIA